MKPVLSILKLALIGAGLLSGSLVFAADPLLAPEQKPSLAPVASVSKPELQVPINSAFYTQLDELRSQNAVLELQLKNAELKGKITAAKSPAKSSLPEIPAFNAPKMRQTMRQTTKSRADNFDSGAQIIQVMRGGGRLSATIKMSSGSTVTATVGKNVKGLGLIKSIQSDEVIVTNGGDENSIPFYSDSNDSAKSSAPGYGAPSPFSGSGLPPPPPYPGQAPGNM